MRLAAKVSKYNKVFFSIKNFICYVKPWNDYNCYERDFDCSPTKNAKGYSNMYQQITEEKNANKKSNGILMRFQIKDNCHANAAASIANETKTK